MDGTIFFSGLIDRLITRMAMVAALLLLLLLLLDAYAVLMRRVNEYKSSSWTCHI
jgi:TRAP-type mannitol/chloroaromatic compound transport system permease small subunit